MRDSDRDEMKTGSQRLDRHGRRDRRSHGAAAGVGRADVATASLSRRFGRVARAAAWARSPRAAADFLRTGSTSERQRAERGASRDVRRCHGHEDHGQQRDHQPEPIVRARRHPMAPALDRGSRVCGFGYAVVYRQNGKRASPFLLSATVSTRTGTPRFPAS
jgi:hypothetical protein